MKYKKKDLKWVDPKRNREAAKKWQKSVEIQNWRTSDLSKISIEKGGGKTILHQPDKGKTLWISRQKKSPM